MHRAVLLFLIIGVIGCCPNYSFAQNAGDNKIETVTRYYDNDVLDSLKLLSREILNSDLRKSDTVIVGKMYYYLAYAHSQEGNFDSVNFFYDLAIDEYEKAGDSAWIGTLNVRKGFNYRNQMNDDTAIVYYRRALPYLVHVKDTLWIGVANDHLGYMLARKGDYYGALKHYQAGIEAFSSMNNMLNVAVGYNAIGVIYRKTGDREKEKQAYLDAIEILSGMEESIYLGEALSNLSELYLDEGRTKEAFQLLERAKTIFTNIDHPLGMVSYNAVLSYYYQNTNPPDYDKVIEYGIRGAELALEIASFREYADACYYIGSAYLGKGNFAMAKKWLQDGYDKAETYQYIPELARLSEELAAYFNKIGDHQNAYILVKQYITLNDSLASADKIKEFTSLDLTFRHRQEQLRDSLVQVQDKKETAFRHKKEIQEKQIIQIILLFSVVVLLLIGVFIYLSSKRNRKQAMELDEKNKIINKSLHEKELLLKEIHHRVKNNFQTISSLLELQSKEVTDQKAISNIQEGQSRIKSMALIHQKLYQNEDLAMIDFQDYLQQLCKQNLVSFRLDHIAFNVKAGDIKLDIDTSIPLGLILNELITNSCKYAFTGKSGGEIKIEILKTENDYRLSYHDSGPGLPDNLDIDLVPSLGLRLIKRLTKQLHGTLDHGYENPATFIIHFKDNKQRREMD